MQETTRQELQDSQEQLLVARVEGDRNALKLEQAGLGDPVSLRAGKENNVPGGTAQQGADGAAGQDMGFIQGYLGRIAQLEKEIRRLKEVCPTYVGAGGTGAIRG